MKVRDIIKVVEADGWCLVSIEGDHRQFKHPVKTGRVTIAGHRNADLPPGLRQSILIQAKLREGR